MSERMSSIHVIYPNCASDITDHRTSERTYLSYAPGAPDMATPPGAKYFPYSSFRAGQEEIIEANRSTIRDRGLALLESPTGTGKTLNAIVPGLEAVERGEIKGIMFVTPRKTQHAVVFDDVARINKQGHDFRVLNLVSKSDLCINENGLQCAYGDCPFMPGKGGQMKLGKPKSKEKIQHSLRSLSKERPSLDVPTALSFGRRFEYCPHRAVIDFAHEAEVVVCDYNYVFSPAIANIMEKKEMEYGKRLLVVDEGHNLYDRVLAFYSATINRGTLESVQSTVKILWSRSNSSFQSLQDDVQEIGKIVVGICRDTNPGQGQDTVIDLEEETLDRLENVCKSITRRLGAEDYHKMLMKELAKLPKDRRERAERSMSRFKDNCSSIIEFLTDRKRFHEEYMTVSWRDGTKDFLLRFKKFDVSGDIHNSISTFRAAIIQSATLSPQPYYRRILGLGDDCMAATYPSPFPPENRLVLVDARMNNAMRYRDLPDTLNGVTERLKTMVTTYPGNYLVFFSSYRELAKYSKRLDLPRGIKVLEEKRSLKQRERDQMMSDMRTRGLMKMPTVLLGVLGGSFSEGIDLKEEGVIGVIVVGMGIPVPSEENKRLQRYLQRSFGDGYNYVFTYPALARIMQAKGRLIRTMRDRGVVYLIDNRILNDRYLKLVPDSLKNEMISVYNTKALKATLDHFWKAEK